MFEKVKRFYDEGLYTADQVRQFLAKGKITQEEYDAIVGENNNI